MPVAVIAGLDAGVDGVEEGFDVGVDGDVGGLVLVDLGGVDIDVDDAPVLAELGDLAGDAVVEPDADGEQQVGLVDRVVGVDRAVHAEHAEGQVVVAGHGAEALEGHGDGDLGFLGELAELAVGAGGDDTAAAVDDGLAGALDGGEGHVDLDGVGRGGQVVAGEVHRGVEVGVGDEGVLDVLGDVDEDGAGAAGGGDVEGFLDDAGDVAGVLDQVVVLGDGATDLDHGGFLEGVGADDLRGNLAGDGDDGEAVELGVGQAGDEVQRAWAGGGHGDAGLAGGAGVAFGGEDAALFVAGQDGADLVRTVGEGLVHGHGGTARVGEDDSTPCRTSASTRTSAPVGCGRVAVGAGLERWSMVDTADLLGSQPLTSRRRHFTPCISARANDKRLGGQPRLS